MTLPNPADLIVYPAGPMSGIEKHNFPMFEHVTEHLRKRLGITVISPHEIMHGGDTHFNDNFEHADYIREDIEHGLSKCNAILLLPGWRESIGARYHELPYAAEHDYYIFTWDDQYHNMVLHSGVPEL